MSLEILTQNKHRLLRDKTIYEWPIASIKKMKCRSLVSLCLGVLGKHLEDIIEDLSEISASFPPHTKMAMMAISRRRKLLNDEILISLVDSSWDTLDISGSHVSDFGLIQVAKRCPSLRAVDVSLCCQVSAVGVSELLKHCCLLETLRCGGCPRSDAAVRRCLGIMKPKLNDVAGDSWEELLDDNKDISNGAESLRWLLWPKIDEDSRESLAAECPRILVNPDSSPFSLRGAQVPKEAIADIPLDEAFVRDIDPKTWEAVPTTSSPRLTTSQGHGGEVHIAERFRQAFVERDARLAPKRAKNERQHRRRANKEWVTTSADAKSIVLASKLAKSLQAWT
ncbi:hypothetical protein ACHQM5_017232 [Ranunculus cassubicifolius]